MTPETSDDDPFDALSKQAASYLTGPEQSLVYQCFGLAVSYEGAGSAVVAELVGLYIEAAAFVARLRMGPQFLGAQLLYLPVSAGLIDSSLRSLPPSLATDAVRAALGSLLEIGAILDQFLPWNRPLGERVLQGRIARDTADALVPIARRASDVEDALLLRALLLHGAPEIPVLKAAERLVILERTQEVPPFELPVRRLLARESLTVHAVALEILGVHALQARLEDAAFSTLAPEAYAALAAELREGRAQREQALDLFGGTIRKLMEDGGVKATVTWRAKHVYGVFLKKERTGQTLDTINDTLGVRIIVSTVTECYQVLALALSTWEPVAGIYERGFCRDWIAKPKPNGYESIHTTVWWVEGGRRRQVEIQIRTQEMHANAEYGVAAHWAYKGGVPVRAGSDKYKEYIRMMGQARQELEARVREEKAR
jgi:ppGpp synthetase/RelA/SpoT-type nucleotidyltranferase